MKKLALYTLFLFFTLPVIARPQPPMKKPSTEEIQINKHKVLIPIKHKSHWVRITEKNDGKESLITVQTKDGPHGKVVTKKYRVKSSQPTADIYTYKQYSEYSPDQKSNKMYKLKNAFRHQQHYIQGILAHTQAEIAAQITVMNQQLQQMQQQIETNFQSPPPKPQMKRPPHEDSSFPAMAHPKQKMMSAPHKHKNRPWWKVLLRKLSQ